MQEFTIAVATPKMPRSQTDMRRRPGGHALPHMRLLCGSFITVALGLLLTAGPADAKPKKVSLGVECSASQLGKAGAQACLSRRDQDVVNDVPNLHFVACLADGTVHCCQKSSAGAGYNCTPARVGAAGDATAPLGDATNAPATDSPAPNPSQGTVFGGIGIFHKAQ